MPNLYARAAFTGFGPAALGSTSAVPELHHLSGRPTELRKGLRKNCPRGPGVYGILGARGELIYVGKAKSLRTRLFCYLRRKGRERKATYIIRHAATIVWEGSDNEFAALLRELELIQRWRPRFNVHGQPSRRRRTYLCLGRAPAPYLFLSRKPPPNTEALFGPVVARRQASLAIRALNDWFRLRDCAQTVPMIFADQPELFPVARSPACLRHELATCLGPCAAACSRADYAARVRAARSFLAGTDISVLEGLERDMQRAAVAQSFERAALLRDRLLAVRWLHERLERLRHAQARHSFVYIVAEKGETPCWYLIERGRVVSCLREPQGVRDWQAAARRIRAVYQKKSLSGPPRLEEVDGIWLVAAWFRRHPDERARTLAPKSALAHCRQRLVETQQLSRRQVTPTPA